MTEDMVAKKADHSVLRLLQISQQHIESQLERVKHERECGVPEGLECRLSWKGTEQNADVLLAPENINIGITLGVVVPGN